MLKKGDAIVIHTVAEADKYDGEIFICKSDEFTSQGGAQVVFLEGFRGYFAVKFLQKVNIQKYISLNED